MGGWAGGRGADGRTGRTGGRMGGRKGRGRADRTDGRGGPCNLVALSGDQMYQHDRLMFTPAPSVSQRPQAVAAPPVGHSIVCFR